MSMYKLYLFIGILIVNTSYAQDTIGDIKYSILEPSIFMELHKGWVLMDGGASKTTDSIYKTSLLWTKYQIPCPDARGVFIRGMNEKRSVTEGDAEGDSTVGRYQNDAIKKHTHDLNKNSHPVATMHGSDKADGRDRLLPTPYKLDIEVKDTGRDLDGKETRPRNIALYIYIKVK